MSRQASKPGLSTDDPHNSKPTAGESQHLAFSHSALLSHWTKPLLIDFGRLLPAYPTSRSGSSCKLAHNRPCSFSQLALPTQRARDVARPCFCRHKTKQARDLQGAFQQHPEISLITKYIRGPRACVPCRMEIRRDQGQVFLH